MAKGDRSGAAARCADRGWTGAALRPDHPRRCAAGRCQHRHRVEGAQQQRQPAPGNARSRVDAGARARLPAQRPCPEPASRPEPDGRDDFDRQLRPLHHADHGRARGVPDRSSHGGLHVQRHRRSRARGAARRSRCSASVSTASWLPRAAPTAAPNCRYRRPTCRCIYVFSQVDDPDACCLLPDDEGGAVLATEHLIDLGRRRIAHITGPERFEAVRLRYNGYRKTLAAAGIARRPTLLSARHLVGRLGP